jgi:hypothetical protein
MQNQMHKDRTRTRRHAHRAGLVLLLGLLLAGSSQAGVFRCVDANGVNTFSDKPCAPTNLGPAAEDPTAPRHPAAATSPPTDNRTLSAKEQKARQLLLKLHITVDSLNSESNESIVDTVAPDLVKHLDPTNDRWGPTHGRWHSVLEFVMGDLRKDIGAALRAGDEEISQQVAREFAAHTQDADLDALLQYLNSPEGGHYVAFQNVVRSLNSQSLRELMAQQPVTAEQPSESVLTQRAKLLSMSLDARIVADGGGPAPNRPSLGSPAVLDNTARREGTALDALYVEYESYVNAFTAFNQGPLAKHFFVAVEPAYRTASALTSTAANVFGEDEEFKYAQRWQAYYGPPLRAIHSSTVVVRNYNGTTIVTSRTPVMTSQSTPEYMALQCEQRESAAYRGRTRYIDANVQAAQLKAIQDRCRAEQNLAPY